ncbi:hypothetical protein ACSTS3_10860 [Aquimarina muelleri]|uniref:hypothetical protein n=1 Tax=Aquimarina muelleri TaxID=279356 RepID=UPI003F687C25
MRHAKYFIYVTLFSLLPLSVFSQKKLDTLLINQLHMITYKHVVSRNYQSTSIQYREFQKETKEFVIPITLSFGSTNIDGSFLEKKNIKDVDTYSLGFGFDGYEHLGGGFYFNLGLGGFIGAELIERISTDKNTRFLIGGNASTGLLYIPFNDLGFVIGFNIIGKLSNSKVLNHSIGFGIEGGLNF